MDWDSCDLSHVGGLWLPSPAPRHPGPQLVVQVCQALRLGGAQAPATQAPALRAGASTVPGGEGGGAGVGHSGLV